MTDRKWVLWKQYKVCGVVMSLGEEATLSVTPESVASSSSSVSFVLPLSSTQGWEVNRCHSLSALCVNISNYLNAHLEILWCTLDRFTMLNGVEVNAEMRLPLLTCTNASLIMVPLDGMPSPGLGWGTATLRVFGPLTKMWTVTKTDKVVNVDIHLASLYTHKTDETLFLQFLWLLFGIATNLHWIYLIFSMCVFWWWLVQ